VAKAQKILPNDTRRPIWETDVRFTHSQQAWLQEHNTAASEDH